MIALLSPNAPELGASAASVKATVAEVLKEDEISKLSLTLKSVLGEEIKLKVEVDTRIIGGIKLRVEDVFLDGSINSQLQGLRNKLLQI